MIETTTKYICDRCKIEMGPGCQFFKIEKHKVDTVVNRSYAYNPPMWSDGIVLKGGFDEYPSFHLCEKCSKIVEEFING